MANAWRITHTIGACNRDFSLLDGDGTGVAKHATPEGGHFFGGGWLMVKVFLHTSHERLTPPLSASAPVSAPGSGIYARRDFTSIDQGKIAWIAQFDAASPTLSQRGGLTS